MEPTNPLATVDSHAVEVRHGNSIGGCFTLLGFVLTGLYCATTATTLLNAPPRTINNPRWISTAGMMPLSVTCKTESCKLGVQYRAVPAKASLETSTCLEMSLGQKATVQVKGVAHPLDGVSIIAVGNETDTLAELHSEMDDGSSIGMPVLPGSTLLNLVMTSDETKGTDETKRVRHEALNKLPRRATMILLITLNDS